MEGNGSIRQHFTWLCSQPYFCVLEGPQTNVVCALAIQACLHCVVKTLAPAQRGVGKAYLPAPLFSQTGLTVPLGKSECRPERVRFPQGVVEIVSVLRPPIVMSLLVELQGFLTACSFFWSCSSSCCQDWLKPT